MTRETGRARLGLMLALLAAALLRFWALSEGIGFKPGVDEPEVMERAVRMFKTGDFNPHFFDYPSLYMYVQALVAIPRFIWGALHREWASLDQASPWAFSLGGRAVTAVFGTLTVVFAYRCGKRWGE